MLKFVKGITKKRAWTVGLTIVLAAVFALSGIVVSDRLSPQSDSVFQVGVGQKVITIGNVAYAAGTADYTCDGVADNVQFQAALDALPANGGKISVLTGDYVFTATVTRAIANVTIEGNGYSTNFTYDGVNPIFTAGGNNWVFRDFVTDAGNINTGATTGWTKENLTEGSNYVALQVSGDIISTGRISIGTANASELLHLVGNNAAIQLEDDSGHWAKIKVGNSQLTIEADPDNAVASTDIVFRMDGSEVARFYQGGNFGIGENSPTALLHIKPPTTSKAQLRFEASAAIDPSTPNSGDLWFNGTNLNFYNGSFTNDLLVSTRVDTLTYTSGTPGAGEFTHSLTQDPSIGNVVIEDIKVVKTNLGNGQAYSKVFINISYLQQDSSFSITLAPNTLTTASIDNIRAFRPTLNVIAYVRAGWTSADILYIDRDNNINGDSPCYFIIEGLGTY